MRNKIHKILGVGLTLVIAMALVMGFAAPVAANPGDYDFDGKINEWVPFQFVEGEDGGWFFDRNIYEVREITEAINGDLYVCVGITDLSYHIFKSTDGARSWADTGYDDVERCGTTDHPGKVVDMVCSSIDEDVVYATDGYYVYKTTDGGDEWGFIARDSLEEQLGGDCGCCLPSCITPNEDNEVITSLDVVYDGDDNPFVYIGTRAHDVDNGAGCTECVAATGAPGDVYYIGEAGYPANWTSLNLTCFHGGGYDALAVGCAPDWADTHQTYVVATNYTDTWVVYTTGTICGWYEFAELEWDCVNSFPSIFASRIAFPDDWADTETLFVGVVDYVDTCTTVTSRGGDVYMVMDGSCLDMNVLGISTGCVGKEAVDIISLDIEGDTDEARLIAGDFCKNKVFCSTDGGWSWDASTKDPTGERLTYVIWYGDTALATTSGCECAVSMCCGEDYPCEFWNQLSLMGTSIDCVIYGDHSPGYLSDESYTVFVLTHCATCCGRGGGTQSLFRYDAAADEWERVFCSTVSGVDAEVHTPSLDFGMVMVSPDFNETSCVYLANDGFQVWRSLDAGCSWDKLTFPCVPRPQVSAGIVIDEDTVITGGGGADAGWVYKTTRHGSRPWDDYEVTDAGWIMSFDLEPGYEDPGSVLLGDNKSQVFISEDGGETWDLVSGAKLPSGTYDTSVAFDPAYATSNIIYAAAGPEIHRCVIDPDAAWADQTWEQICGDTGDTYWGMVAAGDTALYVGDKAKVDSTGGVIDDGGMLRSLNPDAEDAADVIFERVANGLVEDTTRLSGLLLTTDVSDDGCVENVLWSLETPDAACKNIWVYEDTLAAPIVLNMPIDGQKLATTDSATLSWNELCGADCYEVALWKYCAECPDEKLEIAVCGDCACGTDCVTCGPAGAEDLCVEGVGCCTCHTDTCIVIGPAEFPLLDGHYSFGGLEPGTEYYWQVRVCQCKPYLSKWSEVRTFKTALVGVVDLCSPVCGGSDIILTPNFSWDEVDGATGYDIELATTETFTAGVIRGSSTVNAWVAPEDLEYAETYYWRVRAEKDGVLSAWTVCIFTTMGRPEAPPPPVTVEQVPPPQITVEVPVKQIAPNWIYAVIGIGAALVVVVIVLIARTRRPTA